MAMSMHTAFNAKMMTTLTVVTVSAGAYNADNDWIAGSTTEVSFSGVLTTGNKFSQFEEGMSLRAGDGGARFSDYRTLYVKDTVALKIQDKIKHKGKTYNIIQQSDETVFGFNSFLLEAKEL